MVIHSKEDLSVSHGQARQHVLLHIRKKCSEYCGFARNCSGILCGAAGMLGRPGPTDVSNHWLGHRTLCQVHVNTGFLLF